MFTVVASHHSESVARALAHAWESDKPLLLLSPAAKGVETLIQVLQSSGDLPEQPILALLTTGTTGRKLILYSKRCLEASLRGVFSFFDLSRIDSVYCYPQPYHVFGAVLGYLFAQRYHKKLQLAAGAYSSESHAKWLATVGPGTLTLGTPTHFADLALFLRETKRKPPQSYSAIAGGAAVSRELWLTMRDGLNIQMPSIGYGASELSPGATHLAPGREPREDGEIGVPLPNVDFTPVEGEGVRVFAPNQCIAIVTESGVVAPKYILLRDEVVQRSDGVFIFANRNDLLLNRGGEKFSLEQIEKWFAHRLGTEVVAVPCADTRLGQELGVVVPTGFGSRTKELFQLLAKDFGRSFDRRRVVEVPSFPLNGSGKVDRRSCRKWVEENLRGQI